MTTRARCIAVALHDVEPATFERCALIRDWLDDHGIERVTLLVIPAPDLHPFHDRRPEMVDWLAECVARGDAIAQHGFQHRASAAAPRRSNPAAEFLGLDGDETRRAVEAGRRVLRLAGVRPRGFVAPAYAYTGALRQVLTATFDWWAGVWSVHDRHGGRRSPALALGTSGPVRRALSPPFVRAGAVLPQRTIRLDLHPADFDHAGHVRAVEHVLQKAHGRQAVTYDDLC